MHPLKVQLFPKTDTDGQVFFIGKLKFNGTLNVGNGQSFIIYIDDKVKELHIAPSDSTELTDVFRYYKYSRKKTSRNRHNNIAIELEARKEIINDNDMEPKRFFIGKLEIDATVDASYGIVFLVFVADPGEEELQISCQERKYKNKNFQVIEQVKLT